MTDNDVDDVAARIAARLGLGQEARWSYFQRDGGPMFVWNTERIHTMYGGPADGKFESAVFVPIGPGARSGKATRWKTLDGSRSLHDLRKDAKARALRLFNEWLRTGKVEV